MSDKINEGLKSIERIKLLMGYSLSKTLSENVDDILTEQYVYVKNLDGTYTLKNGPYKGIIAPKIYPNIKNGNYPKSLKGIPQIPVVKQQSVNTVPINSSYIKSYLDSHPDEVWDPNVTRDMQSWDSEGNIMTTKIKVGGFVPMTEKNVGLRGTPFGFHPDEYPEYLKKVEEINKYYNNLSSQTNVMPTDYLGSGGQFERDNKTNNYSYKVLELSNLKKQYYHEDFPFGIRKEDYISWANSKKDLTKQQSDEITALRNSLTYQTPTTNPGSDYFLNLNNQNVYNIETNGIAKILKKYSSMNEYLDSLYQYDPYILKEINKTDLDRWWDEKGWVVELGVWLLVDLFSEGMAASISAGRQTFLLSKMFSKLSNPQQAAKIIRYAGSSGFPASLGIADIIKNETVTDDAVLYFVFAVLPFAHNYFKIPSAPTKEIVGSIVKKMGKYNLHNPKELRMYIKQLTEAEKQIFRSVAKLDAESIKTGIASTMKDITKKQMRKISKTNTLSKPINKVIKPSLLVKGGKFVARLSADITAIEISKFLADKVGLTTEDNRRKELDNFFKQQIELRKDPKYRLLLMVNAFEEMSKNPNWVMSKIMSSIVDKTTKELTNQITQAQLDRIEDTLNKMDLINGWLIDENGEPIIFDESDEPLEPKLPNKPDEPRIYDEPDETNK